MEVSGDYNNMMSRGPFCFPPCLAVPVFAGPPPVWKQEQLPLPCYGKRHHHQQKRQPRPGIFWQPPCPGWVKLNVDGSSRGNPGKSGAGGLIRDCNGNWLAGFACNIGFQDSLYAEVYALKKGLELARLMGYKFVEVESDCQVAVKMVIELIRDKASVKPLIEEIRRLLEFDGGWDLCNLSHVYREANQSADILAKMAVTQEEEFKIWMDPPEAVVVRLLADREGY